MDIADVDPLSARSTSSLEDGASSARTKKSKTLARLRKLKKTEISPHDPTKDGLVPHPPDNQQRDVASDRRLSNGLVNGGSDLHDDFTTSTKLGQERINDFTTGADKGKVATLDPLPFNQPNWGEKQTLKSSLFSSPLDPVKPARRGLGGLEPLAPRAGLEPLEMPKPKSQVKPEESIDRVGIGTDGILKDETIEVNGEAKETFNTTAQREHVMSIGGAVETETSDSQDFSSDKDSFKVSNMETNLPAETYVEKESSIKSREQIKDVLVEPIEQLEDSDDDVLVSSAMKERTSIHSTFDDRTNNHTLTSNVPVNNRFLSSFGSDDKDALQVERTKSKTSVTLVEEDDESDDELIVVSPLPSSSKPQTMNVPQNNSEQQMDDDRGEKWKEDDLPNRTGLSKSDDEDDLVEHDSKEDEENLKQYLQNKLQHIEDDEDSDALIPASPSTPSRSGRLSPITNASAPPPLPNTIMSPALRTMYKRDDDLEDSFGTSEISDAVMSGGSFSETNRSMASSSLLLNALTNKSARKGNRSYLSGGVRNTGSLVGKDELDSHLPERRLRIFVATWNMHEDKEIPENLDDLLLPDDIEYMQDVYVIGTQESSPDIAEWEIRLQETLGPSHVLLHSASHGVLHCLVFIRRDLIWFCSPVEESRVSTRPGSMIKTKGAIAVSFNFFGTSFIFIVSHFTSGDENMKERLLDYEKILKGISLPDKVPPTRKFNILTSDVTSRFDCVFWCGDFNFRLAENKARVEGWIDQLKRGNKDDYDILLQHDQLNKAMQRNEIFQGFHEGKIGFLPTYKFDIGEDVYDTSPKARVPSYTDRVLYKSRKVSDISLIHYSSCEEIRTSDHRPVYGVFEAGIRPGKDNSIMGGGMFVRPVYIEGIKRRVAKSGMSKRTQSASAVCSVM